MTLRDLVSISLGNLWRMKLRAFLTIAGVVIAIATFVAMLSFGAGMQANVSQQFQDLGLFSTMQVYSVDEEDLGDSLEVVELDAAAVERLSQIPSVNLAYPLDAFDVTVTLADSEITATAQALPTEAVNTGLFSQLEAGEVFTADSLDQALVSVETAEKLGFIELDSLVGRQIVISVRTAVFDSGLVNVVSDGEGSIRQRLDQFQFDSLINSEYRRRIISGELKNAVTRFIDGYMHRRAIRSDTLTVCGVLDAPGGRTRVKEIIIPLKTALRLNTGGFISDNPADMFQAMQSGNLFQPPGDTTGKTYSQVTLDIDPNVTHQPIMDSVEALGFRSFSYAVQFDEIRKFFFYFDMALAVVGLIALVTASLGIVNTMVMSIIERNREIGVLKSLGADERDMRWLFLAESGVIGSIGAIVGIIFGWGITRIAALVARILMEREGLDFMDPFALPLWLIVLAYFFGLIVSLIAGYYPSARAARVDPVEALRND